MASERRSFPRYLVNCPVEVTLPDDAATRYNVSSNSLSRTSIQIECSAAMISALLRQQKLPYMCHLKFTLPWHTHTYSIDASVVTHRRLSQQHYVLVLLLRHNDEAQENLLEKQLGSQQRMIGLD